MNVLDLLLKADPAAVLKLPEKEYKVKRLSQLCGEPVVFKLRAMPYSKAYDISNTITEDLNIHILLAGVVEPNLKDAGLLGKYGAATPAELVKKLLQPGEIDTIAKTIEQLSGYRVTVLEEIKKN
jgi:hypothetical protein